MATSIRREQRSDVTTVLKEWEEGKLAGYSFRLIQEGAERAIKLHLGTMSTILVSGLVFGYLGCDYAIGTSLVALVPSSLYFVRQGVWHDMATAGEYLQKRGLRQTPEGHQVEKAEQMRLRLLSGQRILSHHLPGSTLEVVHIEKE